MSPFGGFDMPIEYAGIVEEHEAVRRRVGMFDVSHMGEVTVEGPDAERFVNQGRGVDNEPYRRIRCTRK